VQLPTAGTDPDALIVWTARATLAPSQTTRGAAPMSLAAGTHGIDSAITVNEHAAYAAGSRFQVRYSAAAATSPSNPSHGKNAYKLLKPGELKDIVAAGELFIANDEWYANRTLEGAGAAKQDAPVTLDFWRSNGLAKGSTIMLNLDTAYQPSMLGGIEAYIDETNKIWGGYYRADGFYGPLPCVVALSKTGRTKHGWIPGAASWSVAKQLLRDLGISAPPAVTTWDLWEPTASQLAPAMKFLLSKMGGHKLTSCIWQTGNQWPKLGAVDEDVVLISGPLGAHQEHVGTPTPPPGKPPGKPPIKTTLHRPWPAYMRPGNYFGLITGPAVSHGGYYANERGDVKAIQQRLITLGYVPGIRNPASGWADGLFEQPTKDAVARWQHARYAASTSRYGEVWSDDWAHLFTY
jgi:hypothetical protein